MTGALQLSTNPIKIGSPRLNSRGCSILPQTYQMSGGSPRIPRRMRVSHQSACFNLVALTALVPR